MTYALVAASGLLAVLLALAWCREVRLRRALQTLLARIFAFWRNAHGDEPTNHPRDGERGPADAADSSRMQ